MFEVFLICILQANLSLFREMELKCHEHLKPFSGLYDTAAEILVVDLQILKFATELICHWIRSNIAFHFALHRIYTGFTAVVVW